MKKYKSRYDDPEYQKKVSLQMLATPTHEIACSLIVDLRERMKELALRMQQAENSQQHRVYWGTGDLS